MLWIFFLPFWISFVIFGCGHCSISWCDTSLAVIMWESWKRDFYIFRIKTSLSAIWICCKKGEVNERRYMCEMMLCSEYKKSNAFSTGIIKLQTADFIGIENKLCIGTSLKTESNSEKIKLLWSRYLHIIFRNPDVVKHTRDHHHSMKKLRRLNFPISAKIPNSLTQPLRKKLWLLIMPRRLELMFTEPL